jgi:DNA polymerase-3 subunit epsilon
MKKKKDINFRKRDLLFVDLETTGLDFDRHEIIEVGCLVVDGQTLEIIKEYHAKVKPEHIETASKEALKVASYTKKGWVGERPLKKVLKEFVALAPGAMIAGWKVDFDWHFIEKNLKKFGIKHNFDYHLLDFI